ncbi:MAG: hypothetical protein GWO78_03870 [Dehalococcoidales bacterium]|jgi:hypothetical protein|nr:hypothetical protein [Dehalococcoidales bacterium]
MNISIIGISNLSKIIINKIENHCENINVFSTNKNFDFINEYKNKDNIKIILVEDYIEKLDLIKNDSDYIFITTDKDSRNSFLFHKIKLLVELSKIQFSIKNSYLFNLYKNKKYLVINESFIEDNELINIIRS